MIICKVEVDSIANLDNGTSPIVSESAGMMASIDVVSADFTIAAG